MGKECQSFREESQEVLASLAKSFVQLSMKREYRSDFHSRDSYERPAPVSSGLFAQRDDTSLAEFRSEAALACGRRRNGRVVHSNSSASSSWRLYPVVIRRTRGRGTGARRGAKKQAQRRHGREVRGDAAGRPCALRGLAEAFINVGQSLIGKLICDCVFGAVPCLLSASSAGPDACGEGFDGVEAEFLVELDGGVVIRGDRQR